MLNNNEILVKESKVISKYLINKDISEKLCNYYIDAVKKLEISEDKTQKYLNKSLNKVWKLKFYDAAFAFSKNKTTLRRKIFIMLAILETEPEYANLFLEKEMSKTKALFTLTYSGTAAILSFIFGKFFVLIS